MKINSINNSQNFCGKERYVKEFSAQLINGNSGRMRVNLNSAGNPRSIEFYAFDKFGNMTSDGKAIGRNPKLKLSEIFDFLLDVRKVVNEDIFAKFSEKMSR